MTLNRSSGDWLINKTYRVEIQANRIKNLDLVTSSGGNPTYSPATAYWFKTADGCESMFDLSGNGLVGGEAAGVWLLDPVNFNADSVGQYLTR